MRKQRCRPYVLFLVGLVCVLAALAPSIAMPSVVRADDPENGAQRTPGSMLLPGVVAYGGTSDAGGEVIRLEGGSISQRLLA